MQEITCTAWRFIGGEKFHLGTPPKIFVAGHFGQGFPYFLVPEKGDESSSH